MHGEGHIRGAIGTDVLDNHIDIDVGIRYRSQDLVRDAGLVRRPPDRHFRFVAVVGNAGDQRLFHLTFLVGNQRARAGFEG